MMPCPIENELALRRSRSRYISAGFLGEPAWDSLLVLYVASLHGENLTVTTLAARLELPESIVLRWAQVLQREVLVRYTQLGGSVAISNKGKRILEDIFRARGSEVEAA